MRFDIANGRASEFFNGPRSPGVDVTAIAGSPDGLSRPPRRELGEPWSLAQAFRQSLKQNGFPVPSETDSALATARPYAVSGSLGFLS